MLYSVPTNKFLLRSASSYIPVCAGVVYDLNKPLALSKLNLAIIYYMLYILTTFNRFIRDAAKYYVERSVLKLYGGRRGGILIHCLDFVRQSFKYLSRPNFDALTEVAGIGIIRVKKSVVSSKRLVNQVIHLFELLDNTK